MLVLVLRSRWSETQIKYKQMIRWKQWVFANFKENNMYIHKIFLACKELEKNTHTKNLNTMENINVHIIIFVAENQPVSWGRTMVTCIEYWYCSSFPLHCSSSWWKVVYVQLCGVFKFIDWKGTKPYKSPNSLNLVQNSRQVDYKCYRLFAHSVIPFSTFYEEEELLILSYL